VLLSLLRLTTQVSVYTATAPLGPYTKRNVLGTTPPRHAHEAVATTVAAVVAPTGPAPSRQSSALLKLIGGTAASLHQPPVSNPFCGWEKEENTFSVGLVCVNGVIDALPFIAYGTPTGSCPGPFAHDAACDDAGFGAYAAAQCIGKPNCTLTTPVSPDPCYGVVRCHKCSFWALGVLGGACTAGPASFVHPVCEPRSRRSLSSPIALRALADTLPRAHHHHRGPSVRSRLTYSRAFFAFGGRFFMCRSILRLVVVNPIL
jgi:hypothetical protein